MDNLSNLSVDELAKLAAKALEEIDNRHADRLKEVKRQIHELAASIDYTVVLTKSKTGSKKKAVGTPAKAKYRNPNNPDATWSGRGKRPLWVVAHTSNGGEMEELEIK